jgi:hypothetical protein
VAYCIFKLATATIKVSKMNPPMGGKIGSVSFEIEKHRLPATDNRQPAIG